MGRILLFDQTSVAVETVSVKIVRLKVKNIFTFLFLVFFQPSMRLSRLIIITKDSVPQSDATILALSSNSILLWWLYLNATLLFEPGKPSSAYHVLNNMPLSAKTQLLAK